MSNCLYRTHKALVVAFLAFAFFIPVSLSCMAAPEAHAYTAAEKRAEADEITKYIDSLQTSLNEMHALYSQAEADREEAAALRDEAAQRIAEETARVEALQKKMASFAVSMYKSDGAGMFLGVLLQTTSFDEFLMSVDRCVLIYTKGESLIEEEKAACEELERSKATYETQALRAEQKMKIAESTAKQIEATQQALQEQVEALAEEAAKLEEQEKKERERKENEKNEKAEKGESSEKSTKDKEREEEVTDEEAKKADEESKAKEAELEERVRGALAAAAAAAASANAEYDAIVLMGNGYFTNPCPDSTESSGFGYRDFDQAFHKGLDMAADEGTPYYAADDGVVLYATNDGGYNGGAGNWIVIAHGNGIVTKYMHSLTTFVEPGDQVVRGQNIGLVGSTGNSTGPHLHFQVEVDGVAVNPTNYI